MSPRSEPADPRVWRGAEVPDDAEVSVVVLVTSNTARLRRCLDAVVTLRPPIPVSEVLVVANGTPDEELTWLAGRPDIVLLRSRVNLGFGAGCNWAADVARGRRLLFMNDDTVATRGWLQELARALDHDERIAIAGSCVLLSNGSLQEAGGVIWRDGTTSGVGRGLDAAKPEYSARRDADYVSFCSTMVAREAWEAVGGFDDRYFPAYYEDTDLCMRVRELGWRVVCEPRSVVVHEEGRSTSPRFKRFLTHRNRARFVARWGSRLVEYDPPPSPAGGQKVVLRALDRSAARARRSAALWSDRPPSPSAGEAEIPSKEDVRVEELSRLLRMMAVQDEYIDSLCRELDSFGPVALTRATYREWRARAGRMLTRHPGLRRRVRSVVVSVGNRD